MDVHAGDGDMKGGGGEGQKKHQRHWRRLQPLRAPLPAGEPDHQRQKHELGMQDGRLRFGEVQPGERREGIGDERRIDEGVEIALVSQRLRLFLPERVVHHQAPGGARIERRGVAPIDDPPGNRHCDPVAAPVRPVVIEDRGHDQPRSQERQQDDEARGGSGEAG